MTSGKINVVLLLSGVMFVLPFGVFGKEHNQAYTPAITGFLGLNTVPNARMDETGTIRGGISTIDPFMHGFIGVQIADPLSVTFRQTAETSNILKDADRLLPGVDFKLRLLKENAHRPAIAIGFQSALGHKRMAGEYIALSKRYNNFDFTAGIGWGRFGTSAQTDNPLKIFGSHFKKKRDLVGEDPNDPSDWFSGDAVGFFGGVEYFLPYDGLSLKLDYGSDRYTIERDLSGFEPPAPWGVGLSYDYKGWASVGVGMQGTDKIMGRISLQSNPEQWPFRYKDPDEKDNIKLTNITIEDNHFYADLHMPEKTPAPQHIGRATRRIIAYSGKDIKEITLTLKEQSLSGTTITIQRKDIEKALSHRDGSPNEIWNNAHFEAKKSHTKTPLSLRRKNSNVELSFILDNQLSLSEEDSGTLYRSSALINVQNSPFLGFMSGISLRLNLADNLDNLEDLRSPALLPVRSDIAAFTNSRISLERSYLGYTYSITPELHTAISAGYLEEFYAGFGGEILYRPIRSRFAIGAEIWQAFRRHPGTSLNAGLNGTQVTSGHANIWYDIPNQSITAKLSGGRFLAGDTGISLGLEKRFLNGAILSGQTSISNAADPDLFGSTTHAYHMLSLTLPIGSITYVPVGSEIRTKIAPFGRDIAQTIDKPIKLYDLSEAFTLDHMANHWQDILE